MFPRDLRKRAYKQLKALRQASLLAHKNGDSAAQAEAEAKKRYLGQILARDRTLYPTPRVFISFSHATASLHATKAEMLLRAAEFEVVTGFDSPVQTERNLRVLTRYIADCSVFLGIWTKDYDLGASVPNSHSVGGILGVPSPWMLEEKGMAEALRKPLRLLVHECIPVEYVRRVTYGDIWSHFNDANFESQLAEACEALQRRYHELLLPEYQALPSFV